MLKNNQKRIGFALLVLLILILLSVPAIRRHISPKVVAQRTTRGILSYQIRLQGWRLDREDAYTIDFPDVLPESSAVIRQAKLRQNQKISAGELLIKLDAEQLQRTLHRIQAEEIRARLALQNFDRQYPMLCKEAEKSLSSAKKALDKKHYNQKQKESAQEAYDAAHAAWQQLVQEGIMDGQTRDMLSFEHEYIDKRLKKLKAFIEAKCEIRANKDLTILRIMEPFSVLSGAEAGKPFLYVTDKKPFLYLSVSLDDAKMLREGSPIRCIDMDNNSHFFHSSIQKILFHEDAASVVLDSVDNGEAYFSWLDNAVLVVESEMLRILAPNSALIGDDFVYCLIEKFEGSHSEFIVEKRKVKTGKGNELYTPIISGLDSSTPLVLSWDRPIENGAHVIWVNKK